MMTREEFERAVRDAIETEKGVRVLGVVPSNEFEGWEASLHLSIPEAPRPDWYAVVQGRAGRTGPAFVPGNVEKVAHQTRQVIQSARDAADGQIPCIGSVHEINGYPYMVTAADHSRMTITLHRTN